MARPLREPAPVVTAHTGACRDLWEPQGQLRHVQHDLTGLIVLPTQRLAPMARGILARADHTPLSRVRSEAPWRDEAINHRRTRFRRHQPTP